MWFLNKEVFLTKDNLAKRNWSECKNVVFCGICSSHILARLFWHTIHIIYIFLHQLMLLICLEIQITELITKLGLEFVCVL
jgi:hypothetical protein